MESIRVVINPGTTVASNSIDAWASTMNIDRIQGNNNIRRMLLDIDDGTLDGNQRINYTTGADYTDEDADNDGGIGDGNIDMSDFRRWRDWLLYTEGHSDLLLDGSTSQLKKDINGNKKVEAPDEENIYPRGDFNGDGQLSRTRTSFVPGFTTGDWTDLEVLHNPI